MDFEKISISGDTIIFPCTEILKDWDIADWIVRSFFVIIDVVSIRLALLDFGQSDQSGLMDGLQVGDLAFFYLWENASIIIRNQCLGTNIDASIVIDVKPFITEDANLITSWNTN